MYAIIEIGGRQCRVTPGAQVVTNRVPGSVGSSHVVDRVLLASDGKSVKIGRPYCAGAKVVCEVLEHGKAKKAVTFRYRRRENYRRKRGTRQLQSKLLVKDISLS